MARNDISVYDDGVFGQGNGKVFRTNQSSTAIYAGEPIRKAGAGTSGTIVLSFATNMPNVGTDLVVGIALTDSTHTSTASGTVCVAVDMPGMTYLISPNVAATWDTQAEYDALVGSRVLMDLTTGSYTILAADGWSASTGKYGCIIEPLDVAKYPGKVRFSFARNANYLSQT